MSDKRTIIEAIGGSAYLRAFGAYGPIGAAIERSKVMTVASQAVAELQYRDYTASLGQPLPAPPSSPSPGTTE